MNDLIGKSVGSYRILEQVGVGGMATIYKAYQPSMDRYVAIKVLPHYLAKDEQFLHRFQREARAIAKLEHPHILPVFDYGEHDGITYIAMRYVEAGTLKDYMAQAQITLGEISGIITQVSSALDYAHRQGIIHRDVKPGNILIDSQGNTYLTDFGLARIMESSQQFTASGVSVGTPAYMSPEQGKGVKVDHRSDIYALGIMVYEMVTGRVPYEAETPLAVLLKHITEPLPLPRKVMPDISEPVELVILRALAKEPGDRFQSANELAQGLTKAVRRTTLSDDQTTKPAPSLIKSPPTASTEPTPEPVSLVTRAQHTWQTPRGKAVMIGGTAVILIFFAFLLNWLNQSEVAITESRVETETAVTQPAPTVPPTGAAVAAQPTTSPTNEPTRLKEISTLGPDNGLVVDWNHDVTPRQLVLHDAHTGQTISVTNDLEFGAVGVPSWSPNGRQILFPAGSDFAASGQHDHNLYIINTDGSDMRQLTHGDTHDQEAEWSPDGEWIAFYRDCNLWRIRPDGSDEQPLLVSEEFCVEIPTWSPDSQQIAFLYFQNGVAQGIWIVNADGSNPHQVYAFGTVQPIYGGVSWSPEGDRILSGYWEEDSIEEQRVLVNADGSGIDATIDGVPYWWGNGFWPRWGIELEEEETAVPLAPVTTNLTWEQLNDGAVFNRATVTAVATDPQNPNTLYAATGADGSIGNGAGVYKSTDGGATWTPAHNGLDRAAVYGLYIDPVDSQIIYATTFGAGLYKSGDGGQHWQAGNNGMQQLTGWWGGVSMFLFDPADHTHLYHANPTSGIHHSTDGGESWQLINQPDAFFISMAIDPRDGRHLFAGAQYFGEGMLAGGLYESTDGGLFWEPIALNINGIAETSVDNIIIDPNNPDTLFAFLENANRGISSRDGGQSWREISITLFNKNVHDIAFDPADTSAIFLAAENVLMHSSDSGVSWQAVGNPLESDINSLAFADSKLYAGSQGVLWTDDGGNTWDSAATNFGNTWLDLFVDPTSGTLYAEDGRCHLYRSQDEGDTWEQLKSDACGLAIDQQNGKIYRQSEGVLALSDDKGSTWTSAGSGVTDGDNRHLFANPHDSQILYSLNAGGSNPFIHRTIVGEQPWQPISTVSHVPYGRIVMADDGLRMYIAGENAMDVSDDGGETWRVCTTELTQTGSPPAIALHPQNNDTLLLGQWGRGLIKSTDGCHNWQPVNTGLGNLYINTIVYDLQDSNVVYAGTDGGVYVSFDGGDSWNALADDFGLQSIIYSMVVDPTHPGRIFAATPGGIFHITSGVGETAVSPPKIIAHWPFDGNYADNTINGFDLQATGENIDFVPGCFGQAVHFNDDNDSYLTRGRDDDVFDFGTSDYSYELWVKFDTLPVDSHEQTLIEKCAEEGCGMDGWGLTAMDIGESLGYLQNGRGDGTPDFIISNSNQWYHVAVVNHDDAFFVYVNGEEVLTGTRDREVIDSDYPLILGH